MTTLRPPKTEAAFQTNLSIAGKNNMKDIEMRIVLKLISCCTQPTITYSSEVWQQTKSEQTRINRIMGNIIHILLMVPQNTPRDALYIEAGLLDPDTIHDDVIKWKHFPRYWPFVRGIHRSTVNSPHKGQWRGALMFTLICARINGWVNNREAGDLRRYRGHYDVTVMQRQNIMMSSNGIIFRDTVP